MVKVKRSIEMANENKLLVDSDLDFDEMEQLLSDQLENKLSDLDILASQKEEISNPDTLGKVILDTVWDQLMINIGMIAGEDFIKENGNMTLDLSNSAHIQTTENFANGKIADHNKFIDYQERYDNMQSNFQTDEHGNTQLHTDRSGKQKETLKKDARKPYDKNRPTGSKADKIDKDHSISAAEIIRDPGANAHLTESEKITFANSKKNLHDMDSSHNRSKGDLSTDEWLSNKNSKGQMPEENLENLTSEKKEQYKKDDKEAREAYVELKTEGEKKSTKTGKNSQKEEAFRIGGKALRAAIMTLLAELVKEIIQQFIKWLKSGKQKMKNLLSYIKKAIENFANNLKKYLVNGSKQVLTTIVTSIYKPIAQLLTKLVTLLKQGFKSGKEIFEYIENPENSDKPLGVLSLEVGKIVIVGLGAMGTIALSESIEIALSTIPGFSFSIPLLGSLASILGMVGGGLISGLLGALALNFINRLIAKKLQADNMSKQIEVKNDILNVQSKQKIFAEKNLEKVKKVSSDKIIENHENAKVIINESLDRIFEQSEVCKPTNLISNNQDDLIQLQNDLENLL